MALGYQTWLAVMVTQLTFQLLFPLQALFFLLLELDSA